MSGSIILDKSRIFCSLPWTRITFWVYFHFGVIIPRSPNLPVRRRLQWLFFGYWKTWQGIFHLPIPWLSPSESNAWHFLFPGGNVIKLNTHKMVLLVCAVKLEDSGCDARNAEFWPPVTRGQLGASGGWWPLPVSRLRIIISCMQRHQTSQVCEDPGKCLKVTEYFYHFPGSHLN